MTQLASILQAFFTTRVSGQYGASTHTIAAYRDTWRLLLRYAAQTTGTAPAALDLSQLDTDLITGFLTHLETERGNATTTRNARLAAVHSLFSYAAYHHPSTPPRSAESWRSRRNEPIAPTSPTSVRPRSPPCWPPRTGPPGPDVATTR
jgi:site-specific recombinase XerD